MDTPNDPADPIMAFCEGCKSNRACVQYKGHSLCDRCWPRRRRMFGE